MSSPRAPTAILASLHQIPVRLSVFCAQQEPSQSLAVLRAKIALLASMVRTVT